MKKHESYPHSEAFHLAPNAGVSDGKRMKATAEDHASNMPDFGIGHKTENAMYHDWSDREYTMEPHSNGSMNYMAEKDMIMKKDHGRLRKTFVQPGNAV